MQVAVKNRHQSLSHISICNNAAVSVPALDSTNLVPGAGTIHVLVDHATSTVDPASLVDLKLNSQDEELVIRLGPCEPSKAELIVKKVKCGERYRYCSSLVFNHSDGTKRKWLSYSQKRNALYCLPCLLFTDATLRCEHHRLKQGNIFTTDGFSKWKNQYTAIAKHESSYSHRSAVVAQALFMKDQTISASIAMQSKANAERRKRKLKRIDHCCEELWILLYFWVTKVFPLEAIEKLWLMTPSTQGISWRHSNCFPVMT